MANADGNSNKADKTSMLKDLDERSFELWKFYEERSDNLKSESWTLGTWILTVQAAILTLCVTQGKMRLCEHWPLICFDEPRVAAAIFLLTDYSHHIRENWDRAKLLVPPVPVDENLLKKIAKWIGSKRALYTAFVMTVCLLVANIAISWLSG